MARVQVGRFVHAEALLSEHAACFDLVFMSDSRDAYFQQSPFEHMVASGGFYAFAEQTRAGSPQEGACCSVQHQPNNRQWLDLITEFMHEPTPIAEQIGAKAGGLAPILNSGVSGGSTHAVRSYLEHAPHACMHTCILSRVWHVCRCCRTSAACWPR